MELNQGTDIWVVRMDAEGNKLWDKSYGGTGYDRGFVAEPTADGGWVTAGYSSSDPGTGNKKSRGYGARDYWVVWIDAEGNLLRDRSYGGTADDRCLSLVPMPDGGYLLGGQSSSPRSGSKTCPGFGSYDYWLVRIDSGGNQLWDQAIGGNSTEGYDMAQYPPGEGRLPLELMPDGGVLLAGYSKSPVSGTKTAPLDMGWDYWVVRFGPEPPFLRAAPVQPDGVPLTIIGPKNRVFTLQTSSDMAQWSDVTTVTNKAGKVECKDICDPSQGVRFYRAIMK